MDRKRHGTLIYDKESGRYDKKYTETLTQFRMNKPVLQI